MMTKKIKKKQKISFVTHILFRLKYSLVNYLQDISSSRKLNCKINLANYEYYDIRYKRALKNASRHSNLTYQLRSNPTGLVLIEATQ